jgi:hypothetical protein
MIELYDRPPDLPPDTDVQMLLADGRVIGCKILDDTPMCAVIGEGLPTAVKVTRGGRRSTSPS